MDLLLTRIESRHDGIFSELKDPKFKVIAHTLEHSYDSVPKLPDGTYTCIRGEHRLHNMTQTFTTFEVTGVEGHTGILFHWGNWNADSEGCILLGEGIAPSSKGQMITNSKVAFADFMKLQSGLNSFILTVV